jgi:MFS family permease
VVAVEWSIVFWGADFLEKNGDLSRTDAATIMSVYFLATVIGRVGGSRLTHRIVVNRLLLLSLAIAFAGFASFWLVPTLWWTLAGLFVAGLGVANLFPLTLSIASSAVEPHQSDRASGRISLGAGLPSCPLRRFWEVLPMTAAFTPHMKSSQCCSWSHLVSPCATTTASLNQPKLGCAPIIC